jgi:hypothetical protein
MPIDVAVIVFARCLDQAGQRDASVIARLVDMFAKLS